MESSLDSVLSGQAAPEPEPQQVEQTPPQEPMQEPATGEQQPAGTPPEPKQDDPLEKHRKGLEAAAAAERKKRQEAENEARTLREQLQALQQPQRFAPQDDDPKPQRAQFQTEDEWLDARDAWRDRQRERAWQQQETERAERAKKERTESIFAEAMKLPGFDFQSFARLPVSEPMAEAILDSEAGHLLVQHLTANPQEAYRIANLSAARQIKELARIEDQLTTTAPKAEDPPKEKPRLPETLTQQRDARGRFEPAYSGPTPLTSILSK